MRRHGSGGAVPVFYSDAYVSGGPAFDTTRKASWVAESLAARPIPGMLLEAPEPVTLDDLTTVHDRAYVEAVRTGEPRELAETNGFSWDPGLFAATSASTGGAVAAALRALETGTAGSLSSGLHHAKRSRGDGFCTFNGLALAAQAALGAGAGGVLVIDLDAHCGGGTAELLADDPRIAQVDLDVDAFDLYAERGRFTLDTIRDASAYLPTLSSRLEALEPAGFDLVLYNAGDGPVRGLPHRRAPGHDARRPRRARGHRLRLVPRPDLPVAFVLAGGYTNAGLTEDELVDLHRLTLEAAARHA